MSLTRKITEKMIQPEIAPDNFAHVHVNKPLSVMVSVLSDGTNTIVEITDNAYEIVTGTPHLLGRGVARRRAGDARNEPLGTALAYARAFASAANYAANVAAKITGEIQVPDVYSDFAKLDAKLAKQLAKDAHDAKRAKARQAYEDHHGGPWKADK